VSASPRRDGNEPQSEPGDGHVEAGSFEGLDDFAKVVQLCQREFAGDGAVPRRHHATAGVDPITTNHGAPGAVLRAERRLGLGRQVVQHVEHIVAEGGVEPGPADGHRDGGLERERTLTDPGPIPVATTGAVHFQPGTRPACWIHLAISGPWASSRVLTFT
jgi:hypothetical protein